MRALTVGSYTTLSLDRQSNEIFWNATEKVLYMYDGGGWGGIEVLSGFSASAIFRCSWLVLALII